jgi:TPR repeat protein
LLLHNEKKLITYGLFYERNPKMVFKEEDFPLYQLIAREQPDSLGVKMFQKACAGGDEEKVYFCFGIQTGLAGDIEKNEFPAGTTREMIEKTLRSCLAIFEDAASRNHPRALFMSAEFRLWGKGTHIIDLEKAEQWLDRLDALKNTGYEQFSKELRQELDKKKAKVPKPPQPKWWWKKPPGGGGPVRG